MYSSNRLQSNANQPNNNFSSDYQNQSTNNGFANPLMNNYPNMPLYSSIFNISSSNNNNPRRTPPRFSNNNRNNNQGNYQTANSPQINQQFFSQSSSLLGPGPQMNCMSNENFYPMNENLNSGNNNSMYQQSSLLGSPTLNPDLTKPIQNFSKNSNQSRNSKNSNSNSNSKAAKTQSQPTAKANNNNNVSSNKHINLSNLTAVKSPPVTDSAYQQMIRGREANKRNIELATRSITNLKRSRSDLQTPTEKVVAAAETDTERKSESPVVVVDSETNKKVCAINEELHERVKESGTGSSPTGKGDSDDPIELVDEEFEICMESGDDLTAAPAQLPAFLVSSDSQIVPVRGFLSTESEDKPESFSVSCFLCKSCSWILNDEQSVKQHMYTVQHRTQTAKSKEIK